MTPAELSELLKPRFLRTVGAHRANDYSFGLAQARRDIDEGAFGHLPRWACATCGPISEPETICVSRETWGFWGGEPAEYANVCPGCGGEECGEYDDPRLALKQLRRFSIHRNPSYRGAA